MKNLFIDSNIWLSLYHFTSDDLEQFGKIKDMIGEHIQLFIPEQTRNEVQRNRDSKIKDSFDRFKKFELQFPAFCKNYPNYKDFSHDLNKLRERHKEWCDIIRDDIKNQELPADKVISSIFDSCPKVESTEDIIKSAELRYKVGNPPGKDNKLGDAINWETLLFLVPDGEDLFFVSADKDYQSVIGDNSFNLFLLEEWEKKKHSKIHYFSSLVSFINAHVKEISLQTEQEKDDMINALIDSWNFRRTHAIIGALNNYHEWSPQQIDDLCRAVVENNQVSRILGDDDVLTFYDNLLDSTSVETDSVSEVKERINSLLKETEYDEDLPF